MSRIFPVLIIALALLLVSCGDDDNPANGDHKSVIMPLEVGNSWRGTQTEYAPDGAPVYTATYTQMVVDVGTINNELWYTIHLIIASDTSDTGVSFANRNDGLWIWNIGGDTISTIPFMYYKYPAMPGDSYASGPKGHANVTVVSTDTVITVPYGEFNAYLYGYERSGMFNDISYVYLVPDLGLVKWEYYVPGAADELYLKESWGLEELILN
jgi:hypothetical protein